MICLDASVAVKLVLDEELSDRARALVSATLRDRELIVAPPLLPIEITNTLLKHTRAPGGFSVGEAERQLDRFFELPLEIRNPNGLHRQALSLAHAFGLPAAYDAHYVALAETLSCDLWTDDRRLLRTLAGRLPFVRPISDYGAATP